MLKQVSNEVMIYFNKFKVVKSNSIVVFFLHIYELENFQLLLYGVMYYSSMDP
jgi:hypothetical protein